MTRTLSAVLGLGLLLVACGQIATPTAPAPAQVLDAEAPDPLPLTSQSGSKLSDATARARVTAAGIPVVSSGNCSNRNVATCTSLDQVNSGTIDGIITLKRASGCSFSITGGTEVGHASGTYSHFGGYKLDITKGSCINAYITNNFTRIGTRGDGAPQYQSGAGNIYADEYFANHWDILYY